MSKLKPYPKYKDSGVEWLGEIPEGWKTQKIKYLAKIKTGTTPPISNENFYSDKQGYLWIKPEDLSEFDPIKKTERYLTEKGLKKGRAIRQPSVQINCIGDIGEFGITEEEVFSTNQQINSLILKRKTPLNYRYFQYAVFASKDEHKKRSLTVVVPILNTSRQSEIQFPIPSLEGQKGIVNYLSLKQKLINRFIKKQYQEIKLLEKYRQKIISQAVTCGLDENGRLREKPEWKEGDPIPEGWKDSGVEWLGLIPEEFSVKKLKYQLNRNEGGTWGELGERGITVFRSTEITSEGEWNIKAPTKILIDRETFCKKKLKEGDLLITKSSGSEKHIGKTALVNSGVAKSNAVFSNFMQRVSPKESVSSKFIYYILNSQIARTQYKVQQNSTSGLGNLNSQNINNLIFAFPSRSKQAEISQYLDQKSFTLKGLVRKREKEIDRLREFKQSLISKVVTGKLFMK